MACACAARQPLRLANPCLAHFHRRRSRQSFRGQTVHRTKTGCRATQSARSRVSKPMRQPIKALGKGLILSGPSYVYQQGPDGLHYAIGGEVRIDTSRQYTRRVPAKSTANPSRRPSTSATFCARIALVADAASQMEPRGIPSTQTRNFREKSDLGRTAKHRKSTTKNVQRKQHRRTRRYSSLDQPSQRSPQTGAFYLMPASTRPVTLPIKVRGAYLEQTKLRLI